MTYYNTQIYSDDTGEYRVNDIIQYAINNTSLTNVSTRLLLNNLEQSPEDKPEDIPGNPVFVKRAMKADLKYPIIIIKYTDGMWIADGVHRLWKAVHKGARTIKAYVIPNKSLKKIKKGIGMKEQLELILEERCMRILEHFDSLIEEDQIIFLDEVTDAAKKKVDKRIKLKKRLKQAAVASAGAAAGTVAAATVTHGAALAAAGKIVVKKGMDKASDPNVAKKIVDGGAKEAIKQGGEVIRAGAAKYAKIQGTSASIGLAVGALAALSVYGIYKYKMNLDRRIIKARKSNNKEKLGKLLKKKSEADKEYKKKLAKADAKEKAKLKKKIDKNKN